jgi:uncharacterized protein (DUF58 family)
VLQELLQKNKTLGLMLIKAQKEVYSSIVGENNVKTTGSGYDFVELKEYQSGDDIKYIDWIISSKIGKPHVKLFHQQKELNSVIVPLLCSSLYFGTKRLKSELLNEVCALLTYSCIKQNDPFESYIGNNSLSLVTKRGKQLFDVRTLAEKIAAYDYMHKEILWREIERELYKKIYKPSLLFLIGDFLDAQKTDLNILSKKHELILIIVRDRFEEHPHAIGELHITDPASHQNSIIKLDKKSAKKVQEQMLNNDDILYTKLKTLGIRFVKIYTDENPAQKILSLMSHA